MGDLEDVPWYAAAWICLVIAALVFALVGVWALVWTVRGLLAFAVELTELMQ